MLEMWHTPTTKRDEGVNCQDDVKGGGQKLRHSLLKMLQKMTIEI
jgi:hypothetical protein